jgi:F-type H+-transporting ATPase subunit gamma
LVKRRKAVRNIRKITRTMQLIATARFQAAFNRAVAARPYTEKLAELVADIGRAAGAIEHPLLRTRERVERAALVVLTSQRGLCGGYNSSVLRAAFAHLEEQEGRGVPTDVHMVGRKGVAYFRFVRRPLHDQSTHISDRPRFEEVEPLANSLMERFLRGEVDAVHVGYMRFHSASRQRPEVIQLLPLAPAAGAASPAPREVLYEFHPDPATLLAELLPATVRVRLYQAFIDAAVSEQIARMVAMKAATEASEEMIRGLTLKYNRARQTAITMELLDIVGGANALA